MKYLTHLSSNTRLGSLVLMILAFALSLTVCVNSYANTSTRTSNQAKTLPTNYLTISKQVTNIAGAPPGLGRRSIGLSDRYTNFTGSEIPRLSVTDRQSNYGSAVQISDLSNLSANSITSTSANLQTIRANRFANFLSRGISKTVPRYLAGSQAKNLKTFAEQPERNSKILRIDKRRPLFKPPSSAPEIGVILVRYHRLE